MDTYRAHSGFTLIETFVAISILAFAIIAPLSLASRSLATARYARDQVVASNLAQDAIEFVRAKRDYNLIVIAKTGTGDWASGIPVSTPPASDIPFIVDSVYGTIRQCTGTCESIRYDTASGLYTYDTASTVSPYRRTLTVRRSTTNPDEATVRAQVTWRSSVFGTDRTVTIEDELYGWVPTQNP